jgi:hypothetical protein
VDRKLKKALELLIKIAEKYRRQHYAFDHNLFEKGLVSDRTKLAHASYIEITEAINTIKEKLGNEKTLPRT